MDENGKPKATMSATVMARIINSQDDLLIRLEDWRKKLSQETVTRSKKDKLPEWKIQVDNTWRQLAENHGKIMSNDPPAVYLNVFESASIVMNEIKDLFNAIDNTLYADRETEKTKNTTDTNSEEISGKVSGQGSTVYDMENDDETSNAVGGNILDDQDIRNVTQMPTTTGVNQQEIVQPHNVNTTATTVVESMTSVNQQQNVNNQQYMAVGQSFVMQPQPSGNPTPFIMPTQQLSGQQFNAPIQQAPPITSNGQQNLLPTTMVGPSSVHQGGGYQQYHQQQTTYILDPIRGFVPVNTLPQNPVQLGQPAAPTATGFTIDDMIRVMTESQRLNQNNTQHNLSIRAPELKLKNFDGNIEDYNEFKKTFCLLTGNMAPLQKLMLLKSHLQGTAQTVTSSLAIIDTNYDVAWELLDKQFNNKRYMLTTYYDALMNGHRAVNKDAESTLRFMSDFQNHLINIESLKVPEESFHLHHIMKLMDEGMRARFFESLGDGSVLPTKKQLVEFCQRDVGIYSHIKSKHTKTHKLALPATALATPKKEKTKTLALDATTKPSPRCFLCKDPHVTIECPMFLSSDNREKLLRHFKICIYCVKHKYDYRNPCRVRENLKCEAPGCFDKHITLMHPLIPIAGVQPTTNTTTACLTLNEMVPEAKIEPENATEKTTCYSTISYSNSSLPTAIANFMTPDGTLIPLRCLVDQCSQRSYINENIVQIFKMKRKPTDVLIQGVNGIHGRAKWEVDTCIVLDDPSLAPIEFVPLVVPKVTGVVPSHRVQVKIGPLDKSLADPTFYKPGKVFALLGLDVTTSLFKIGVGNELTPEGFLKQPTHLGWLVSGQTKTNSASVISTFVATTESLIHMQRDEEEQSRIMNFYDAPVREATDEDVQEDDYCTKLYNEKHYRTETGRYVVPMPWKPNAPELGSSYRDAVRFFRGHELRMLKDPEHYQLNNEFMSTYLSMGHMEPIPDHLQRDDSGQVHYLKYFSVLRKDALTTKLRNVFNGSSPTSNGVTLNDQLLTGPKLQTSIIEVLTAFRINRYTVTGDIKMFYRQILICMEDRDKLRILYRKKPTEQIQEFRLTTVTYGTDPAPYQAIKTLHQCADDNSPDEETKKVIKESFYVDDFANGGDTVEECQQLIKNVDLTLKAGGFPMTKWGSNNQEVLAEVDPSKRLSAFLPTQDDDKPPQIGKILGIIYDPISDEFGLNIKEPTTIKYTKRGLSSVCAGFYDPLGFLLPFIMTLRIFMQSLWAAGLHWDDEAGDEIKTKFNQLIANVMCLRQIRVPRWMGTKKISCLELIGFSDASGVGIAAVIYSRFKTAEGYCVNLLASKGKVTPMKTQANAESKMCTIPKMELEGFILLIDLYLAISKALTDLCITFTCFVDSEIVIYWFRSKKELENKAIKRRINKARKILKPHELNHVRSKENPADPASRGLSPSQLADCDLWFNGPSWLHDETLPVTIFDSEQSTDTFATTTQEVWDITTRFSNFATMIKAIALCRRWTPKRIRSGPVTADEVTASRKLLIKIQQKIWFNKEIENLKANKPVPIKSWTRTLSPFIDQEGIFRVGGRLGNATGISENQRHPILLGKGHFTELIITHTHVTHLHAGNSLVERALIENYWIPGIKQRIKKCIRQCVICIRWNKRVIQPHMAQLPETRVTPAETFKNIGVDLTGPFSIKASPIKFDRMIKTWIVVFICFATKAVHLEVTSSLSSENFLAAFSRFASRRGTPTTITSDRGSNFIGANRALKETWEKITQSCKDKLAIQEIKWNLIPRHSPTFGGYWEIVNKALKQFLNRMANVKNLTLEEFETLLCNIEAMLNSRPLYQNALTPEDEPALTPFHFINLRGYKPMAIDGSPSMKISVTKRWLLLHQIQLDFWATLKTLYLSKLQKKHKWIKPVPNLKIDDVVLIKEPNTSPGDWGLGRVIKTFPDPSGTVRKVEVKSANKERQLHAVNQLVPLLPDSDLDDQPSQGNINIDNLATSDNESPRELRRSPRLRKERSLFSRICITWLALAVAKGSVQSFDISSLNPGVHIHTMGDTFIKTFDLTFTAMTQINVTDDVSQIKQYVAEFSSTCEGNELQEVLNYCKQLQKALTSTAEACISDIEASYGTPRRKRGYGAIANAIWRGSAKYAPEILVGLGLMYQGNEISSLSSKLKETRERLVKTSSLLLNITDMEFDNVNNKIDALIVTQKQDEIKQTITSYAENISLLLEKFKLKHENIINIKPLKELKQHMLSLQEKFPDTTIPNLKNPSDIFTIHSAKKMCLQSGEVVIEFTIPLVKNSTYTRVILISVPNKNLSATTFQGKLHQEFIVDKTITNIGFPSKSHKVYDNIYDKVHFNSIDKCIQNILEMNSTTSCENTANVNYKDELFAPGKDFAIVFATSKWKCICADGIRNLNSTIATVEFPNCIISLGNLTLAAATQPSFSVEDKILHLDLLEPPPKTKHPDIKPNPHLDSMRSELEKTISSSWLDDNSWSFIGWTSLAGAISVTIIAIAIGMIGVKRTKKNRANLQTSWTQNPDLQKWLKTLNDSNDSHADK